MAQTPIPDTVVDSGVLVCTVQSLLASSHLSFGEPVLGVRDVREVCISQRDERGLKLLASQAAAPCEEEEGVGGVHRRGSTGTGMRVGRQPGPRWRESEAAVPAGSGS